jgi:hypothetical protein
MKLFDICILEGDKINPMHVIIHQRTSEWMTHCVVLQDEHGHTWDARSGGIKNGFLREYSGRKVSVLRYKKEIDDKKLFDWITETQNNCLGYDYAALIGFLTGLQCFQDDRRYYCSELCYWLFQANGYPLTRLDRTFIYPADLYYNNEFEQVDAFIIPGQVDPRTSEFPEMSVSG